MDLGSHAKIITYYVLINLEKKFTHSENFRRFSIQKYVIVRVDTPQNASFIIHSTGANEFPLSLEVISGTKRNPAVT